MSFARTYLIAALILLPFAVFLSWLVAYAPLLDHVLLSDSYGLMVCLLVLLPLGAIFPTMLRGLTRRKRR